MKISEIINEGAADYFKSWGRVGSRLAKSFVGKDPSDPWKTKTALPSTVASYSTYDPDLNPSYGEIYVVHHKGDVFFKGHNGKWYNNQTRSEKHFDTTHGLDRYEDYEVLDRYLKSGNYGIATVKQDKVITSRLNATSMRKPSENELAPNTGAGADSPMGIVDQHGNPIK